MFCLVCGQYLSGCTCSEADRDKRYRYVSDKGGFVAMKWCQLCDRHYSLCRCDAPSWVLRVNGEFKPLPGPPRGMEGQGYTT